jgi:hypothetical protein
MNKKQVNYPHQRKEKNFMAVDDDRLEFWFQLYGITALAGLAVNVETIAKLSHICDKRAKMCKHVMAFLPSLVPLTFACLAYLGLIIPATFIHVDEGKPNTDDYYDDVNWIVYVVMLLAFLWPHIYTTDYYSSKKWKKYVYSSYPYVVGLSNLLYWIVPIIMTCLMVVSVVLTAIDGRYTAMGLYIGLTILFGITSLYFTLEWIWCGSVFSRINNYYGRRKTVIEVIQIMERDAEQSQSSGITVAMTRREPMYGPPRMMYRKKW